MSKPFFAVAVHGGLGDGLGLVRGVVEDLDLQEVLRIADAADGIHQPLHDVHLVVQGKLDRHAGQAGRQRLRKRAVVTVPVVQEHHDVPMESEHGEDDESQEVKAKDREIKRAHGLRIRSPRLRKRPRRPQLAPLALSPPRPRLRSGI